MFGILAMLGLGAVGFYSLWSMIHYVTNEFSAETTRIRNKPNTSRVQDYRSNTTGANAYRQYVQSMETKRYR